MGIGSLRVRAKMRSYFSRTLICRAVSAAQAIPDTPLGFPGKTPSDEFTERSPFISAFPESISFAAPPVTKPETFHPYELQLGIFPRYLCHINLLGLKGRIPAATD